MLIALEDDGCLHVYSSPAAAVAEVEGLDAEETFRQVFDEKAVPYRIDWTTPNTEHRLLGLIGVVGSGRYELVPAGPPDPVGFAALFRNARTPIPPEAAALLADLTKSS